ncbi:MAG TPA: alkaline phosphatase family protein [Myxococcota bacterium]|nr:alkaline phosphatase family protein [Myxococcota bacterium]
MATARAAATIRPARFDARSRLAVLVALAMACAPAGPTRPGAGAAGPTLPPGLILVIVVDQMRADELDPRSGDGFGWIESHGRVFRQARVDHAHTETCPGHAVVLTGRQPGPAGIPGNVFVLRDSGESRYCVEDPDPATRELTGDGGRSPRWLRVTALGDWLHEADPKARVHAVSSKDRAAIILGGQHPDGAWWMDRSLGTGFTTSHYYRDRLPDWVDRFNARQFFDHAPSSWRHPHEGPGERIDDYPAESPRFERASPHPVHLGDDRAADLERLLWSPWGDEVVMRFALELIEREQLGQRGHLDLLAVSLSSLDLVGHLYGPESRESIDAVAKLDDWLEDFLDDVEDEVDEDHLWIALTSDHGVSPIPEWLAESGRSVCPIPGGRADSRALAGALNTYLSGKLGPADGEWVQRSGYRFTVNRSIAAERHVSVADVSRESRTFLEAQRGIRRVWTAEDLEAGEGPEPYLSLYRHSWDAERGGDFEIQAEPTCLFTTYPTGTNHGTPYDYDRRVPLAFVGPGIARGSVGDPVSTVDLAPTLAAFLGIPMPAGLDGRPLALGKSDSDD